MKKSPENDAIETIFRDSAWKYFTVHANQRLKLFQFYITICSALLAAGGLVIRLDEYMPLLVFLGGFTAFVSFIFWKLDCRTNFLVKRGEEALKTLDDRHDIPNIEDEGPSTTVAVLCSWLDAADNDTIAPPTDADDATCTTPTPARHRATP